MHNASMHGWDYLIKGVLGLTHHAYSVACSPRIRIYERGICHSSACSFITAYHGTAQYTITPRGCYRGLKLASSLLYRCMLAWAHIEPAMEGSSAGCQVLCPKKLHQIARRPLQLLL